MKITRRTALGLLASVFLPPIARAGSFEPEYLRPYLRAAQMPELSERLPKKPRVVNLTAMGRTPGGYGGSLRILIGSQKDIRLMTIYGYSRLVGYDGKLALQPDILESVENIDDRIFTFKIRDGHRWSDGSYLTSEDFRYCFEDVILNEELRKNGPPAEMLVDGKPPRFEVIDLLTVRYTWDAPNPDFLPQLAAPQALSIVLPAAYMKQFHRKYQDDFRLSALMAEQRVKKWTELHVRMSRQYRPENPELPTLDPWRNTTKPPAEQFVFERNPYFHRIDENGRQLPYIDRIYLNISSPAIISAKAGAAETDLQTLGIDFSDYTFLKDAEKRHPLRVSLWKRTKGSQVALLPNLNCKDETWRPLLRDVRFRRALSLAIDREEINKAVFYGLAKASADTVLPESPLFRPEYAAAWSSYDPAQASALLDELGLLKDDEGQRRLPNGELAQIIVETAGESTEETDILELIGDHWQTVGLKLFVRNSQRDVLRSRATGGDVMMTMWGGIDNGVPTADMNPGELAPTRDDQLQWPLWGLYYLSNGDKGSPPDLPEAARLLDLLNAWRRTVTTAERAKIWAEMLEIYTQQVYSIGIVNSTLQPVLRTARLHNLPNDGLYGFDPTSYLGVYMPDTFWLDGEV